MPNKQFTTAKRRTKPIVFDLDGDTYHFTAPKTAGMVLTVIDNGEAGDANSPFAAKATLDWLSQGLPDEENARLIERLRDPKDDFDFPDLGPIIEYLVEQATGNPTPPR
jgi:hypothetical protein